MQAGMLRHRLIVQRATETRDAFGGVTQTWATLATRWGAVEPLRGQEALLAQQVDSRMTHRVTMRYDASVALVPTDRIQHASRTLEILAVRNIDERNRAWDILAAEVVA